MSLPPLSTLTIATLFDRSVEHFANREACAAFEGTVRLTYLEVKQRVVALQELLLSQGISKGDTVALLGENAPYWGVAYLALTTMGVIAVPILPDFHPNEMRHILRHAQCKGIIISEKNHETLYDEHFEDLSFIINLNTLELIEEAHQTSKFGSLFERLRNKTITPSSKTVPTEEDTAVIIYTSGTSGHSKGVILTHKNITSNVDATRHVADITPEDVFLSILPMAHTFECTVGFLTPFSMGASVYYIDKVPTPRVLLGALEKIRPTFMLTVPLIIEKIYKNRIAPKFQSSAVMRALYSVPLVRKKLHAIAGKKLIQTFGGRLRFFGIGGAKLSEHVEAFLKEANFPYAIGYGLTETAPIIAAASVGKTIVGSTGPQLPGVELKLASINDAGEGEVIAKGPNVMKGYFKDPENSASVLKDGWFYTGDLGRFDDNGNLFICGRSKNVIVGPSGENIYPEQIELILGEREEVLDTIVYSDNGQLVAKVHLDYEKFDQTHAPKNLSEKETLDAIHVLLEELRVDLNTKVSSFSRVTRFIEQREAFEKTPTKKIKRYLYL